MKKALLTLLFLVLAAGGALADTELIQNGGFETGVLSPWYVARNFCSGGTCSPWAVTNSNPHTGTYSAMDIGNIEMRQDFTPTPGSQITDISFWIYTMLRRTRSTSSTPTVRMRNSSSLPRRTRGRWNSYRRCGHRKNPVRLLHLGFISSLTTYLDDVSITATPEPSTLVLLGGSALTLCGNLRRRMKR